MTSLLYDIVFDQIQTFNTQVIDIEEMVWGQRYGLKGMIDASLRVRTNTNSAEANEVIMPLEFKTGKGTSGQVC